MDRRYIAGTRDGSIQTYLTCMANAEAVQDGTEKTVIVKVVMFSETPEEAIEQYKAQYPGFEPNMVWELIPRAIKETLGNEL